MKRLNIILGLIQGLFSKAFPFLTYKGVIDAQIRVYNKLKKKYPDVPEDEVLNVLIISRIESKPRVASREIELNHYESLLENPNKTLKEVISGIVDWEYIESRKEYVCKRLVKMGASPSEMLGQINAFDLKVKREIGEAIDKKVKDIS